MIQLQILNKVLDTKDPTILLKNNLTADYFSDCAKEFEFIKTHVDSYGAVPDVQTFLNKFPNFERINVSEPDDYLLAELHRDKLNTLMATGFNAAKRNVMADDIDSAVTNVIDLAQALSKSRSLKCVDLLQNTEERYQAYIDRCNDFDKYYVRTGFKELDEIIHGWDRTEELATIAARTNQGKSWILLKMVAAALEQGLKVGVYSGEMSERKVGYRLDTMIGHISNSGLIRGKREIQSEYRHYLDTLKDKFPNACCKVLTPNMIDGPAGVNALRTFIEKEELDILFVDQHSLLEDDRKAKTPVEKASNISRDLKNLQVLKQIPIIAVSQQNRSATDQGVGTEHIAQSDRISQDSTIIIFFEQNKNYHLLTMSLVKSRDSVNMKKLQYMFDFDKGLFKYLPEAPDGEEGPELNQDEINKQLLDLYNEFETIGDDVF